MKPPAEGRTFNLANIEQGGVICQIISRLFADFLTNKGFLGDLSE
jgi:hypothetical protein